MQPDDPKQNDGLIDNQHSLEAIIETLPAIFFVKDKDSRYLRINKRFELALGTTKEQLLGKTDLAIVPEGMARAHMEMDRQVMAGGIPLTFEQRVPHPDGTLHDYLVTKSPLFDQSGEVNAMLGMAVDTTHLNRLKNQLAHAEALAHLGSWQLDIPHDELLWSEETYRIFDIPPDQKMNLGAFLACIHPEDLEAVGAAWQSALDKRTTYQIEHRILAKGKVKWVREQADIQFDDQGNPLLALGSVLDISEIKQAELAAQEAMAAAQRLAQSKSDFLANMSHEIRTPLNGIIGFARIGARENKGWAAAETFQQIMDASEHLLGIINDVLDLSKIDAGKLEVDRHAFHLRSALQQSANAVRELAERKGLQFSLSLPDDLPKTVEGDQRRLQQILINLLGNAVKFTQSGEARLTVTRQGDHTSFAVSDTGIGMNEDQIARLFKPFEQADASTTRKFGGTGLGLAISQHLAQLMGGDIQVQSKEGVGSLFTLHLDLPEASIEGGTDTEVDEPRSGRLSGLRILAAEDVDINRLVLEDMLQQEDAAYELVNNGLEAVAKVKAKQDGFDLVLMDVQMPEMDGREATRLIHQIRPDLPVIALTAHALQEERELCRQAGMVDHIIKPIDPDELVEVVTRHARSATLADISRMTGQSLLQPKPSAPIPKPRPMEQVMDFDGLLAHCDGSLDLAERLLTLLLESHGETPASLRHAAAAKDFSSLIQIAHKLAGLLGSLQARCLYQTARQTELWSRQNDAKALVLTEMLADGVERLLTQAANQLKQSH